MIGKKLVLEARKQAIQLGMPLYACVSGDYCACLYKDECEFTELGEHVSWMFKPEYRWKYFVYRPDQRCVELLRAEKGPRPNPFDFGWGAIRGL